MTRNPVTATEKLPVEEVARLFVQLPWRMRITAHKWRRERRDGTDLLTCGGPSGRCNGGVARLLVIHHSPTRAVAAITESVLAGCHDEAIEDVEIVACRALDFATGSATVDDILGADGYLLGTTANFGYMSGALKHVFDSTFLAIGGSLAPDGSAAPAGGSTTGRPFGLYVHGRYDTTGAVRSVTSIAGALGWRQAFSVLEVMGDVGEDALSRAYELGATLAAVVGELTQREAT